MASNELQYHVPALLAECMESLDIRSDGVYVDATFGGGGHSRAIVDRLGAGGHLYSFDQDDEAVLRAFTDERFTIVYGNFRFLKNFMRYYGVSEVDGILADLGVSFHHFDDSKRGFSFRFGGRLDMRMNRYAEHSAAWVLENYTQDRLAQMFTLYGDLKQGARIAADIVRLRESGSPVDTVAALTDAVKRHISPRKEKKELAMVFQALRIEVNDEMRALRQFLLQAQELLKPGGRLAVITYHSIEDRLVKNFMKSGNFTGDVERDFYGRMNIAMKPLSGKPVVPTDQEVERNPRSRSAKLRVAEKL